MVINAVYVTQGKRCSFGLLMQYLGKSGSSCHCDAFIHVGHADES